MDKILKCRSCGYEFKPKYRNGVLISRLCFDCLSKKAVAKVRKQKKDAWNKEKKEIKDKLKSHSDYYNDLQKEINSLVRAIDFGNKCISSGSKNGKINAGHYYSVGSNNTLRFNLHNIFIQSEHSNTYLHGDIHNYRIGLKNTFGDDYLNFIESLPIIHKEIKLTVDEIKDKIKIVRALIKSHDKVVLSSIDRIKYRNKYNRIIGIYESKY